MLTVKIPESIVEATGRLAHIDGLLTATKWERAAIVWAFIGGDVRPGRPSHDPGKCTTFRALSIREFAALGIAGLTTQDTVRRYHDAWDDAIKYGRATPVHPGEQVELPALPWPYEPPRVEGFRRRDPALMAAVEVAAARLGVSVNSALAVIQTPNAVRAAIEASDKLAAVAREAVITRGADTAGERGERAPRGEADLIDDAAVIRHGQYVLAAMIAAEDGRYEPGPAAALILAALRPVTDWDAELTALGRG